MLKKRLVGLATGALLLTACTNAQGAERQKNVLSEEQPQAITMDKAKEIAFNHANVDGSKAQFDDAEYDERHNEYELEFYVDGVEFEYDISAVDGTILDAEKDDVDFDDANEKDTNKDNSSEFISLDEAKEIAFDHAGVDGSKAKFDDAELEKSDKRYELEFYIDDVEYEFDIHAVTGDVIEYERDEVDVDADDDQVKREVKQEEKQVANNQKKEQSTISKDKALSIAMNHVGVTGKQINDLEVELDHDDGLTMYEIEFEVGDLEYEFDINAFNGSIIDFEKDN